MKKQLHVIQTTKPSWVIEIDAKLIDLEDRSRRNNLRFGGIKEHENGSWEYCENRIYDLLGKKLEMDIETLSSNEHIEPRRKTRIDRGL